MKRSLSLYTPLPPPLLLRTEPHYMLCVSHSSAIFGNIYHYGLLLSSLSRVTRHKLLFYIFVYICHGFHMSMCMMMIDSFPLPLGRRGSAFGLTSIPPSGGRNREQRKHQGNTATVYLLFHAYTFFAATVDTMSSKYYPCCHEILSHYFSLLCHSQAVLGAA